MSANERIHSEVKGFPEKLADQVLDFVLFLKDRHALSSMKTKLLQNCRNSPSWTRKTDT